MLTADDLASAFDALGYVPMTAKEVIKTRAYCAKIWGLPETENLASWKGENWEPSDIVIRGHKFSNDAILLVRIK